MTLSTIAAEYLFGKKDACAAREETMEHIRQMVTDLMPSVCERYGLRPEVACFEGSLRSRA